jgi:hypothetical protein
MRKILFLLLVAFGFLNLYAGQADGMPKWAGGIIFFSVIGASAVYAFGLWLYVLLDVWKTEDMSGKMLYIAALFLLHVFTVVVYILFKKRWNIVKITVLFYAGIGFVKLLSGLS